MAKFTTHLHSLRVIDGDTQVKFENGVYDTSDKSEIKAIKNSRSFIDGQIVEVESEVEAPPAPPAPRGNVANLKPNKAKDEAPPAPVEPPAPEAPATTPAPEAPATTPAPIEPPADENTGVNP